MLGTKVEVEGWYSISMISETLVQLFDKNYFVVNIIALIEFFTLFSCHNQNGNQTLDYQSLYQTGELR